MSEIYVSNSFEDMLEHVQQGKERAKASMSQAQWELCDGREHWAMFLESVGPNSPPILAVVHIPSRTQFINNQLAYVPQEDWGKDCEALDEAAYPIPLYYGEDGVLSYGYVPAESWDTVYQVDEPDLHDRHASILMEITKEQFDELRSIQQDPRLARMVPHLRALMLAWIETAGS